MRLSFEQPLTLLAAADGLQILLTYAKTTYVSTVSVKRLSLYPQLSLAERPKPLAIRLVSQSKREGAFVHSRAMK